jgi:hypothetical protein
VRQDVGSRDNGDPPVLTGPGLDGQADPPPEPVVRCHTNTMPMDPDAFLTSS